MAVQDFDKLNNIQRKDRHIPYDEWFGDIAKLGEQEIAQHRGNSSQKEASEEIAPLPAGEEQQDNVYEIKDERAAQVPRQYKDPDMHSRSRMALQKISTE